MPKSSPILILTVWAAVIVLSICEAPARDLGQWDGVDALHRTVLNMMPFCGSSCIVMPGLPEKIVGFPFRSGNGLLPVHGRLRLLASSAADTRAMAVGFHSRGELPAFDDIDHLVLARLTLKGALLNRVHPAQVE